MYSVLLKWECLNLKNVRLQVEPDFERGTLIQCDKFRGILITTAYVTIRKLGYCKIHYLKEWLAVP